MTLSAAVAVACVAAGCATDSTGASGTHSSAPVAASAPLAVHLVFAGVLRGEMTSTDNVLRPGNENPQSDLASLPASTQCNTFDSGAGNDFVASITGTVAGSSVRLSVEVNADNAAYTSPGTPLTPGDTNTGGSTNLQLPGDTSPRYDVLGPKGQEPSRIVLNNDRHSGSIDAWFDEAGHSQKDSAAVEHVVGTWRCAP